MTIKVGDKMPKGQFTRIGANGPEPSRPTIYSKARRSCCSPSPARSRRRAPPSTCRDSSQNADALKKKGVDTIACMAVNDVFVMHAWGESSKVGDKVLMLADGNGEYARALGLELDASKFGMGTRGKRFSMIVDRTASSSSSTSSRPASSA